MNRETQISDETLIEAIRTGDGNAAARLYHRYIDRVHRICYRIVMDSTLVKDCAQEVWFKVFRNLDRYQPGKSFVPWLNALTVNTAIDFYRSSKKRKTRFVGDEQQVDLLVSNDRNGQQICEEKRKQWLIDQALEEISVTQRTAFVLRYYEEMPIEEIARTLDCSVFTVRTHIRRSMLALRKKLMNKVTV